MNKKLLSFILSAPFAVAVMHGQTITDSLNFSGAVQTWTVPCGVTSINVTCVGAQGGSGATGGNSSTGGFGGFGSLATGTLAVTPGDVLNIYVGGAGGTPTPGFNGGGSGGSTNAGGGGGASDVRVNSILVADRVIVGAGGGGGGRGGCEPSIVNGGDGGVGGADGANGTDAATPGGTAGGGGGGFTNGTGGTAGIGCGGFLGQPGINTAIEIGGDGGAGQACCCFSFPSIPGGGGGGGGFVGGGGGGGGSAGTTGCSGNDKGAGGGGGGGSNYTGGVTSSSTMNGVRVGDGVVILSYANPIPGAVTISGATAICETTSTTLTCTTDANGNATFYTWTVPVGLTFNSGQNTTSIDITGATAGTYTVTAEADNTCGAGPVASYTITVNPLPTVTASATATTICAGDVVTINAGGAVTYFWTPTSETTSTVVETPVSTTQYNAIGTDANGCVNNAAVTITVNPLPSVSPNFSSIAVCDGSMVLLFGQNATTYSWSGPQPIMDNVAFAATTSGTYTVTGTDANSCSNTATATVTVNPLPLVNTNFSTGTFCSGDMVTLIGSGASSYVWSGPQPIMDNVPFAATASGTYTVTGTDANSCTGTATATITVNPLPVVTATAASNTVCINDAIVALTGSPVGGSWSGPGVTGSSFNPMTAGTGASTLVYTFTNGNGCTNTASTVITVNACVGIIDGNTLSSGVSVFPNPTSGIFTINVNANIGDMMIQVVDVQGRVVFSSNEKNVQAGFTKSVSLAGLPNGDYVVNLSSANEHASHTVTLTK